MILDHQGLHQYTPDQALQRLREGNQRFLQGEARFPTLQSEVLEELSKGQQPFATILGCSDSRVPPEFIFDSGLGELFVIRVAGNVLGPSIYGTLEYATKHLRTPLFVVLGHEGCGAVEAAIAARFEGAQAGGRIETLLEQIVPVLDELPAQTAPAERLSLAVEASVRRTLRRLRDSPEGQAHLADDGMKLIGAIYELDSGRVRFLD